MRKFLSVLVGIVLVERGKEVGWLVKIRLFMIFRMFSCEGRYEVRIDSYVSLSRWNLSMFVVRGKY